MAVNPSLIQLELEVEALLLAKQYILANDKTNAVNTITQVQTDLGTMITALNAAANVSTLAGLA